MSTHQQGDYDNIAELRMRREIRAALGEPLIASQSSDSVKVRARRLRARNQRRRVVLGVAAVALVASIVTVIGRPKNHGSTVVIDQPPIVAAPPTASPLSRRAIALSSTPANGISTTSDGIWVAMWETGEVIRVDPTTGRILQHVPIGSPRQGPISLAGNGRTAWVLNYADRTMVRLSPAGNGISARVKLGGQPEAVAVTPQAVFVMTCCVSSPNRHVISQVDPESLRIVSVVSVAAASETEKLIAAAEGVWIFGENPGLCRIDFETHNAQCISAVSSDSRVTIGGGFVWSVGSNSREIARRDAHGSVVRISLTSDEAVKSLAATDTALWVATDSKLYRIDFTGHVVEAWSVTGVDVLYRDGSHVWAVQGTSLIAVA